MPLFRRIVFYAFIVLYCTICPLTILYALGYLYRPGAENSIVKTGLIYLSTLPPGATIRLDRKTHSEKTPAILRGLEAGTYSVGISLAGYLPWSQDVPVEAEKATVLERILLLPREMNRSRTNDRRWRDIVPLKDTLFLLLGDEDRIGQAAIFDARDSSISPIADSESPAGSGRIRSIVTVPESACALLRASSGAAEKLLWLDAEKRPLALADVTGLFSGKPERIGWDVRDRDQAYAYRAGSLEFADIGTGQIRARFGEGLRGYGFMDKKVFALDADFRLRRLSAEGADEEELFSDPALGETLFGEGRFYEIRPLDRENILFIGDDGSLLSNRLPYRFVAQGLIGCDWEPEEKRLLIWQAGRLGIIDFSQTQEKRDVFERGPSLVWVYRGAKNILRAEWIYRGSHAVFQDGESVYLLDLETYGKPHLHKLAETKKGAAAVYSEKLGKLFYIEPSGSRLESLELVPKKSIPLLPFPERREEKKKKGIRAL